MSHNAGKREKRRRQRRAAVGAAIALGTTGAIPGTADAADIQVSNTNPNGPGSLDAAITEANATSALDRIVFPAGLSGEITLAAQLPTVTNPIEIVGPGRSALAINGHDTFRILQVDSAATISGLTLKNGHAETEYSYSYSYGVEYGGGAILVGENASVTADSVDFAGNRTVDDRGGAINADGASNVAIRNSTFSGSYAQNGGGAVFINSNYYSGSPTFLSVSGSSFTDNRTDSSMYYSGGAIKASGRVKATIEGSTFTVNAAGIGGAIQAASAGSVAIEGSHFNSNRAGKGAAVDLRGSFDISGSTFYSNFSDYSGGAISAQPHRSSTITSSTIAGNGTGTASSPSNSFGGGIEVEGSAPLRLQNVTIAGNTAFGGSGGGINSENDAVELNSVTVAGNAVAGKTSGSFTTGGGVSQNQGKMEITNSIISGNTADVHPDLSTGSSSDPYYVGTLGSLEVSFSLMGNPAGIPYTTDFKGSNITYQDPQLGPVYNNGGSTKTMLPSPTSPVINKGLSLLPTDQRGLTRPVDFNSIPFAKFPAANGADMGAVEVQGGPLPSNEFTVVRTTLNRKKGIATLRVKVPGPGSLILGGKFVVGQKLSSKEKGAINVPVKPKGKAAKALRKGKAMIAVKLTFTPTGGNPNTQSRAVKLVKQKKRKKPGSR